jgi:hypothetical protein
VSERAVVLRVHESTWLRGGANLGPSSGMKWSSMLDTITVRVEPESGPPFESTCRLTGFTGRDSPSSGDETYVRYDPANPGKCRIDLDRLTAEFHSSKLSTIPEWWAKEQRDGPAPPPVPYGAPVAPAETSVDQLEKLADLHAKGVLDDAEFAAQKAKILGEPDAR